VKKKPNGFLFSREKSSEKQKALRDEDRKSLCDPAAKAKTADNRTFERSRFCGSS